MRRRVRSTIKWSGTVLTVLLLVVWVGSAWWRCGVATPNLVINVEAGCIRGMFADAWSITFEHLDWEGPTRNQASFDWWFDVFQHTTSGTVDSSVHTYTFTYFTLPIWPVVALVGTPALWLFWRDRRRAPGLCIKCGYDLRGTDHAVCPECGAAAARESNREA